MWTHTRGFRNVIPVTNYETADQIMLDHVKMCQFKATDARAEILKHRKFIISYR